MKKMGDLQKAIPTAEVDSNGAFNFDARELITKQVESGKFTATSASQRQWNNELFFNDFKADFVTSAFLMELPKIEVEGQPGEYYTKDQIKVLDSSGDAFYDVIKGKSSEYLRKEFEKHWTDIFNWLIDNYYSKNRELPDYEANAKILKGEFGKGNLFLWNTATWDMSGAAKEFKPHGSLTDGNGNVELKYGQAIKWNQENESNPLMMIGGLGTYQLAKHKEISMAFLQYLARKESSYTWMKNSRGMMFDSSSFETIETELDAIVNDESLTEDQKIKNLKNSLIQLMLTNPILTLNMLNIELAEWNKQSLMLNKEQLFLHIQHEQVF
ncbi:hypothetical protein SCLARK_00264 [Spiroplasma clarkii]|uniref:hypothetical protein n=1 Tax=Spiroplasma clarkii TaxID=2139 RepID=UPI000B5795FA|nr:hypothetical protein [Spiroplasma clarkii]ARU91023.1 hypothetical protein SCLARK_00264 [Spiroplasma clarkii]